MARENMNLKKYVVFEMVKILKEYTDRNANMAFGDPVRITFIAENRAVPIVIDSFGKGVEFRERKDGRYDCTVRVPTFDMKLFAMQHAGFIQVTAPEDLEKEIREELQKAAEKYKT